MSEVVNRYFSATGDLVSGFLKNLKSDDPEAYQGLNVAARNGAIFKIETSFSAAGVLECRIILIDALGEELEIGVLDIFHAARN